jgi:hypothetical protein
MTAYLEPTEETGRAFVMQFNFVVSTNERAVALWQRVGFDIVGRLPQAFEQRDGRCAGDV